jgi:hypothetical protein
MWVEMKVNSSRWIRPRTCPCSSSPITRALVPDLVGSPGNAIAYELEKIPTQRP